MPKSLITLYGFLFCYALWGQTTPSQLAYQAVVRDSQGAVLSNQEISVEFAIRSVEPNGPIVFEEVHPLINTSIHGVFTAQIGAGIPTGNGSYISLEEIPWHQGPYFTEVRAVLPGQGAPVVLGVTQLLAVPYALHSQTADHALNESDNSPSNETLTNISFDGVNLVFEEGSSSFAYDATDLFDVLGNDNSSDNELIEGIFALDQTTLQINEGGQTNTGNVSAISYATWNESDTAVFNTTQKVGVGIDAPNSTLHVAGSQSVAYRIVAGDADTPGPTVGQLENNDYVVICDITEEDVTLTLPNAAVCEGRTYRIRKYSVSPSSYDINLVPVSGQLIDGSNNLTMGWPLAEYLTILSTGSAWITIEHSKE
jgi:hypothetical protein